MRELMPSHPDNRPVSHDLREVFHIARPRTRLVSQPFSCAAFDLGAGSGRAFLGTVSSEHIGLEEAHRFHYAPLIWTAISAGTCRGCSAGWARGCSAPTPARRPPAVG